MSVASKTVFQQQLLQKRFQNKSKKIKIKKILRWNIPTQFFRSYKNIIIDILKQYFLKIEFKVLKNYTNWLKERQSIIYDEFSDDLETLENEELSPIFENEKLKLKSSLVLLYKYLSTFNKNQWNKITKNSFGVEPVNFEEWEKKTMEFFISKNVNLIKNLTNEYKKQVIDSIIKNIEKNNSFSSVRDEILKINTKFSKNRADIIARDQVLKINSQLTSIRMRDVGVETYYWRTSLDERVVGNPDGIYPNPTKSHGDHWNFEGMLCKIDDDSVYSDDNGVTWKKRHGDHPKGKPSEEPGCRCIQEPNFEKIVEEINNSE